MAVITYSTQWLFVKSKKFQDISTRCINIPNFVFLNELENFGGAFGKNKFRYDLPLSASKYNFFTWNSNTD